MLSMLLLTYVLIAAKAGALRTNILLMLMLMDDVFKLNELLLELMLRMFLLMLAALVLIDDVFKSIELLLELMLRMFLLMLAALMLIDDVFNLIELLLMLMLAAFVLIDEVLIDMFVEI